VRISFHLQIYLAYIDMFLHISYTGCYLCIYTYILDIVPSCTLSFLFGLNGLPTNHICLVRSSCFRHSLPSLAAYLMIFTRSHVMHTAFEPYGRAHFKCDRVVKLFYPHTETINRYCRHVGNLQTMR
jgi:hypothetical protein